MRPVNALSTILIVDDTPSNLAVVVSLFEDRGYRVSIAQDGEEGMRRAQLLQPDLILLDVMMPGIDGFETCRRLKIQDSTRDIPVIFMTALAMPEQKVEGFRAGAVDYVTKPLQIDEIMARVDTHLKLSAAQKKLAEHNEELERRVAERTAELAAREREFRTLAENLPDNIARYDKQCRIIYMNSSLLKILGKTLAERIDMTPMEIAPGDMYFDYQAMLQRTIETGRPGEMELVIPGVGDAIRYHHIRFVAERDEAGNVIGALAIGRDITQQKLVDAAIREREQRYRQLFENSPVSIWEEDFSAVRVYFDELQKSGIEDIEAWFDAHPDAVGHCAELARVVDVNQAAVALHQAHSKEELFAGLKQTFTPDSFRAFREELIGLWRGKTEMKLDAVVQTLTGEPRHVAVHFSIAPDSGKPWSRVLVSLMDITERKQAELQLAMLGAAIDHAHEAAYFVDEYGGFFYVNEEASRMLGYSREELLGMTVMDIAPGWTPEVMAESWRAISEAGAVTIEAEHRHKDGCIIPVEINISHMNYGGRAFNLAMVRDITERKRAERELHLLNRAMDNSFDAAYLIDEDLRFRYVNEAAVRELGYSREELLAMTVLDIDHNLTREIMQEVMKQTVAGGDAHRTIESSHRRKNGEIFPVEVGATAFTYEGETLHLTTVRDISERKQAESALQESEQRYREIFDNAVEGMYLLEVTPDGRFRNIEINPALAASTGIPREQLIGKYVEETVPPEVAAAVIDKYRRCAASGETLTEEIALDVPLGKRYYYSTMTPIYHGERVSRLIGISRDITVLKQTEQDLQESRELLRGLSASREAAREEERKHIAREVHDELGQILTGLQLSVSVLDHKFSPGLPELKTHLKDTKGLTDQALAVARNVASSLRPAALDMGIQSALEWLAGRFGANTGILCKLDLAEDEISLDEKQAIALFRIVQESLTNVSRHAQATRVNISFGMWGSEYVLKVKDNGKGFDAQARKTGSYGLVGIQERALMLGGHVGITSKRGKGTEVEVRIPANNGKVKS